MCTTRAIQYNFQNEKKGERERRVLMEGRTRDCSKAIFTLVTDLQPLAFLNRVKGEITFHDNEQVLLDLGRVNQVSTCFGYIPAKHLEHV